MGRKGEVISGVLNFVDLAGSERPARSGNEGKRFQEAVVVNSSLSALSKVILALVIHSRGGGKHQREHCYVRGRGTGAVVFW